MICVACGGEIPAGSRFCPRCGRAVNPSEATPGGTDAPPSASPPGAPSNPPPGPPPGYPSGAYGPAPGGYPSPYGGTAGPVEYGLATFGQRAGGLIIDTFIVWIATGFLMIAAASTIPEETFTDPNPDPSGLGLLLMLFGWLIGPAYYVFLEGRPDGQTLGKKAMGIRVVRQSNGAPLGYGLAVGRLLARFVNFITLGIGLLWAAWDPQRQALHDKIAGTLVVRSSVYPPPGSSTGQPPSYQQPAPPGGPYQPG